MGFTCRRRGRGVFRNSPAIFRGIRLSSLRHPIDAPEHTYCTIRRTMKTKTAEGDFLADNNKMLVEWGKRYATGIQLIDEQHQELINLTNKLFAACLAGDQTERVFKDTVRGVVEYINYHFSAEEKMLEKINYPELAEHKKQHTSLAKQVLKNIQLFEEGRAFIPNSFVRAMKDWILTHIAVMDKRYVDYIVTLKKTGGLRSVLCKEKEPAPPFPV